MHPLIPTLIGTVLNSVAPSGDGTQAPPVPMVSLRSIPAEAYRADMAPPQNNIVWLSGTTLALSPGVQIRDQQNRIVMPGMVQQKQPVRFTLDAAGSVFRVWMLTPQEATAPAPKYR